MVNDAQEQSSPNTDGRGDGRTNDKCDVIKSVQILEYKGLLWTCGLRKICLTALWLPLGALLFCYATAATFQADDVHETHCRVYNVVPSISAITGVSPQRYIWRICIAFHLWPRLLIGSIYYKYHKVRTEYITDIKILTGIFEVGTRTNLGPHYTLAPTSNTPMRALATKLGEACYWLNFIEVCALSGVTYISNRENYFVHEKIFIVFMITALVHMLCRARVGCIASDTVEPVRTNKDVWKLFYVAIAATIGVIIFFLRHRLLCRPLAFTWFSICEYILASSIMAFHAIVVRDLPSHELQVVCPISSKAN